MVLLGDVAQVEARFGPFGHSASRIYHRLRKSFSTHPMELLGDVGHVKSRAVHLEMVLVLM